MLELFNLVSIRVCFSSRDCSLMVLSMFGGVCVCLCAVRVCVCGGEGSPGSSISPTTLDYETRICEYSRLREHVYEFD